MWALRLVYWEQKGQIITKQDTSREFDIKAGVRQGCVLSPRLFSCVLEVALKKWREQLQDGGLDFGDGGFPLLDLRFADDILLFATSSVEAARMVDALVTCLKEVGLALNASKTKVLTAAMQNSHNSKRSGNGNFGCDFGAQMAWMLVINIECWQQKS